MLFKLHVDEGNATSKVSPSLASKESCLWNIYWSKIDCKYQRWAKGNPYNHQAGYAKRPPKDHPLSPFSHYHPLHDVGTSGRTASNPTVTESRPPYNYFLLILCLLFSLKMTTSGVSFTKILLTLHLSMLQQLLTSLYQYNKIIFWI